MFAALDMGWRLAVVVLLPIALGSTLDNHFKLKPWLTLAGLLVAIMGGVLVIRAAVKKADKAIAAANEGSTRD